ncbi:MAG TPA: glycoside hydrolase family 127 protein [Vicinamibacterales bacterium]
MGFPLCGIVSQHTMARQYLALIGVAGSLALSLLLLADTGSPGYRLRSVPFTDVRLADRFWAPRVETNRTVTIPFGFRKSEEEGRIRNFEVAAGLREGEYEGKMPFDDTDVYKLIEGASYSLQSHPDPELDRFLDGIIAKIAAAQEPDGYLTTYKTIDETKSPAWWLKPGPRWVLELQGSHELYNAGHLYEAAYAHFRATGKRTLLDVALKNADLIDRTFGPGRLTTPPGHQIIETGLMKLWAITGEDRYRKLAKFFLDQRGVPANRTLFGEYNQDHKPVVEQDEAVGHAVRAAYMYSGMVDVAAIDDDPLYARAVERIWDNVVSRKLYLTGAIGSRHDGEAFGADFELPNRTAYGETCASIANVYWNQRMFLRSGDAKYVDVLERTLYNAAIAGVSLQGDTFFYPNPLESDGRYAFNHGALTRKPWFDASCCPTNIARFIPSVPDYIYAVGPDGLYVNLFVASDASVSLDGASLRIRQETDYPWDGRISIVLTPEAPRAFTLRVRIPGWARGRPVPSELYRYVDGSGGEPELRVNGTRITPPLVNGYAVISRTWSPGDTVTLDLPMPVRRVVADERVADDRGKVALERGPLVYAAEGVDNDGAVLDLVIPDDAAFETERRPDLLNGVVVLTAPVADRAGRRRTLTAIPYYAWSHRGEGEMAVWLWRKQD